MSGGTVCAHRRAARDDSPAMRSEEHTSELQSQSNLVCRLLLEKKNRGEMSSACSFASRRRPLYFYRGDWILLSEGFTDCFLASESAVATVVVRIPARCVRLACE